MAEGWYKMGQPLQKTVWSFLKYLNIEILYDPAIQLQNIHEKQPQDSIFKASRFEELVVLFLIFKKCFSKLPFLLFWEIKHIKTYNTV